MELNFEQNISSTDLLPLEKKRTKFSTNHYKESGLEQKFK